MSFLRKKLRKLFIAMGVSLSLGVSLSPFVSLSLGVSLSQNLKTFFQNLNKFSKTGFMVESHKVVIVF